MVKGGRGNRLTDADIEEAIGYLVDMPKLKGARCPNGVSYIAVFERSKKNSALRAKYDAAINARNARFGIVINTYTDADIDRAVAILNARPDDGAEYLLNEARARGEHVPVSDVVRKHLERRGGKHIAFNSKREKIRQKFASPAASRARAPRPTRLTVDELRSPLLRCTLYANARRLLRVGESQDSDDILSDAIVAMLESRQIDRRKIISAHHRKVSSMSMISLDENLADGVGILDQYRYDDAVIEAAF